MLETSFLTLEQIVAWLSKLSTEYYQCQHCIGLHIVRIQKSGDVCDAKIELIDDILSYRIVAEIRQTAIATLVAELSIINASSRFLKVFLEITDNSTPKLVILHALPCNEGLTYRQFANFIQQVEEEALHIIYELKQCDMLSNKQLLIYPNISISHTYH